MKVEAQIKISIISQGSMGPLATVTLDVSETREVMDPSLAFKVAKEMERRFYNAEAGRIADQGGNDEN